MDADDEIFPVDLDQLLPALPGDDDLQDSAPNGDIASDFTGAITTCFSTQLERLLAALSNDDPLLKPTQRTPCLPRLEGVKPFVMQDIPGKGLGVLAARHISAGRIILDDPFIISIREPVREPDTNEEASDLLKSTLLQLISQYIELPLDLRKQLASLHAHIESTSYEWFRAYLEHFEANVSEVYLKFIVRLYFTFNTNEFSKYVPGRRDGGKIRRLFLTTSRINHACCPNARSTQTTDGHKVVTALRDIHEGEEITLRYLHHYRYTRTQWHDATQRMWGFVCNCTGCASKLDDDGC